MLRIFSNKQSKAPERTAPEPASLNKFQEFAAKSGNTTGRVNGGYIPKARLYFPRGESKS